MRTESERACRALLVRCRAWVGLIDGKLIDGKYYADSWQNSLEKCGPCTSVRDGWDDIAPVFLSLPLSLVRPSCPSRPFCLFWVLALQKR